FLVIGYSNASSTFSGVLSGNAVGSLYKFGTGTITLDNASNPFQGSTVIWGGTLLINSSQSASAGFAQPVNTANPTLGGNGSVGPISFVGACTLAPGDSPGTIISSSNVTFAFSSTYQVDITGPTAGTNGYDQLIVATTNFLNGANLSI